MMRPNFEVNKKLLAIKGHFFFFNAGTAPLVPYLSTYARQMGFSSSTVGLIYTILPIFGLVAKPLFGIIADRFKKQKSIFIFFQIVIIVSFGAIYFVPTVDTNVTVKMDCNGGVSVLKSCYIDSDSVNSCKVDTLGNTVTTAECRMNCRMPTERMWQTVCEHWAMPDFCYKKSKEVHFTSQITDVTRKDDYTYLKAGNVTLDGYIFVPQCRSLEALNETQRCHLVCPGTDLNNKLMRNLTCVDRHLNFLFESKDVNELEAMASAGEKGCQVNCDLTINEAWKLSDLCANWQADVTPTCQAKSTTDEHLPSNLTVSARIRLTTAMTLKECVFFEVVHLTLPDGSVHFPQCEPSSPYQNISQLFSSTCEIISCDNTMLDELFVEAHESTQDEPAQFTGQFWLFFTLMSISWIGQAVVVTFADAICFKILGDDAANYGKQRLWASVGFGIFSFLTGTLIDAFSPPGSQKDYTVAFILMAVFLGGDVLVSCFIKAESQLSQNIFSDIGNAFSSLRTGLFMIWTIAVGLGTGLIWSFLFWLIEDIFRAQCTDQDYTKTLQGAVSAIQTFGGEIPFLFLSGYILKKIGHTNMMHIVLFGFGVRFLLYSILTNAWWILPIELFQGLTSGMFYPTMTSYANVISKPGTETTVQGVVGAIFEGVGTSLGSLIGGHLYTLVGGQRTFGYFGYGSLIAGVLHVIAHYFLDKARPVKRPVGVFQEYTSVMRYEQPNDMVYMLGDGQKPA